MKSKTNAALLVSTAILTISSGRVQAASTGDNATPKTKGSTVVGQAEFNPFKEASGLIADASLVFSFAVAFS